MAPELLAGTDCSTKIDIFSVGCIVFQLLAGKPLFDGDTKEALLQNNQQCKISEMLKKYTKKCSKSLKNFLYKLLEKDPSERIDAK